MNPCFLILSELLGHMTHRRLHRLVGSIQRRIGGYEGRATPFRYARYILNNVVY